MITGPEEGAAAGHGRMRASHADREHVIDTLKTASRNFPGTPGDRARGAGPGCELFPQPGDVFPGQAVAGEPVIAETVEPLSCVREVLCGQARVQGHREACELGAL